MANFERLGYEIRRAADQVDQWDAVEQGHGPTLDNLTERAETLIDVLRGIVEAANERSTDD